MNKTTDWVGRWFEMAERLGDSMKIISAKLNTDGDPHWTVMNHSSTDGIGAVTRLLHGASAVPPLARARARTGFFKKLRALIAHASLRSQKLKWKTYDKSEVGYSPALAWTVFSLEDSAAIQKFMRSHNVSLSSLLLLSLDETVRTHFVDGGMTRWVMPINMRGLLHENDHPNQISFIHVPLVPADNLESLHRGIKRKLNEGNHWAYWWLMHVGKFIGRARAERLYQKNYRDPNPDTGTFSNLGNWKSDRIAPGESFITSAPCSKLTPITLAVISVNDVLSATLQIHPSLAVSAKDVIEFMKLWLKKLEQRSQIPLNQQICHADICSGERLDKNE